MPVFDISIYEKENEKNEFFTLNDSYSKKIRQIEILKYSFEKFIPFSQHNFNHIYISQRISRIFESSDISHHFEIFSEFENRAISSEFSVINNCEDVNIFMNVIFSFTDYSRYWCDIENYENVFKEFNQQNFNKEEIENDEIVCSFHEEILTRIVKPFFQLLSAFCPMEEMKEKIHDNCRLKTNGKPINIESFHYKVTDNQNDVIISDYNSHSSANDEYLIKLNDLNETPKKTTNNYLLLDLRKQNLIETNSNDDEYSFIDDGNGEDVDSD